MTRAIPIVNDKICTCGHSTAQGGGCKHFKQQFDHGTLRLCTHQEAAHFGHYLSPYHPWCSRFEVETAFTNHLERSSQIVSTWPPWKQAVLGGKSKT